MRAAPSVSLTASAIVGAISAIVGIVASYLANERIMGPLFNADSIQMPAVFADIFERGGSFADWNIAPAPAIVPEYGMYAIAYVLGGTLFWRVLIYSVLQIVMLWVMVFGLARVAGLGVRNAVIAPSVTVALMSLLCLLHVQNFLQLVQSAFHFGGFLLQILMFALVVLLLRARTRPRQILLLGSVAFLTVVASLNDALFVVQMVVPLAVLTLGAIVFRYVDWRRGVLFMAVIGVSAFLGFKLYPRLIPHPTLTISRFDPSGVGDDLSELGLTISDVYTSTPVLVIFAVTTIALGVLAAIEFVRRREVARFRVFSSDAIRALAVVAVLASLTSVVAVFLTSAIASPRYLLPLDYWPCILVPLVVVELRWKWAPLLAASLALVLGVSSAGLGVASLVAKGVHTDYYPSWSECVDNAAATYGVRHALGTYWVTKPIQELSRSGITVTSVTDIQGQNFWVASNKNQFDAYDAFIDQNAHPSDAILAQIRAVAGTPITTVKCKRVTISIWQPGSIATSDLIEK